ncbi:hypothetical protein [Serratia ureilytica]|uniref:hypothetical protein n=1 Tax=Serratia ureilytica TaxID=300181 RepID=UPI00371F33EA
MNQPMMPLSRFDGSWNVIANYSAIEFDNTMGASAFIIRVTEMNELDKLKSTLDKFSEITGYSLNISAVRKEELAALAGFSNEFCKEVSDEIDDLEEQLKLVASDLKLSDVTDISSWGKSAAEKSLRLMDKQDTLKRSINDAKEELAFRLELIADLQSVCQRTRTMGEYNALSVLISCHSSKVADLKKYGGTTSPNNRASLAYINDALSELNGALMFIIGHCTDPTDKYLVNNGGLARAELYRTYYGQSGERYRQEMPGDEFVSLMIKRQSIIHRRIKMMNSKFI